jgi:hypothetical protein
MFKFLRNVLKILKLKKKTRTSDWERGCQPVLKRKTIYVKPKKPFELNEKYIEDRENFDRLFKINNVEPPVYFKKLANHLKNKNRVSKIFEYANMYLRGKTIKEIEAMQKVPKKITSVKPSARIVKKR